jgi:hypothetical protein
VSGLPISSRPRRRSLASTEAPRNRLGKCDDLIEGLDPTFVSPAAKWISVIEHNDYAEHGWHAVDFETLDAGKFDLEQWWADMCQGEAFTP